MGRRKTKTEVSYNMSRIRSSGTRMEKMMASFLWKEGLRGYRKNAGSITGKPDFSWKKHKIAVFCDSEFWHGKNWKAAKREIKSNRDFWIPKIERNIERDKDVNKILKNSGWIVIRIWGKDIEKKLGSCVKRVERAIERQNE